MERIFLVIIYIYNYSGYFIQQIILRIMVKFCFCSYFFFFLDFVYDF